jgi:hypothetical protein
MPPEEQLVLEASTVSVVLSASKAGLLQDKVLAYLRDRSKYCQWRRQWQHQVELKQLCILPG